MTKQELALEVIERLKKEYPDADCTLDYDNAWKLLVSVRLAAQCTDARVNVVVVGLYDIYPTVEALAEAPVEDIEVYDIEASFTVNLSPSGDGKDHVAVFSIGLSLNTKSDGYKSIGTEGLKAKETLIKNDINTIVSGYTMEQFREDEQSVKDAILEDLQEMFGSDFIVGVSFSSVNTQ